MTIAEGTPIEIVIPKSIAITDGTICDDTDSTKYFYPRE